MPSLILSVFLSSTGQDLADYRRAVVDRLRFSDNIRCDAMETFGARDAAALEFCRERVQACDVFVGLIGHYRGEEAPGDNQQRSFTELEYLWATEAEKPRLMYVTPDDFVTVAAIPAQSAKTRRRQASFRARILRSHWPPRTIAIKPGINTGRASVWVTFV